jgi:hypothetical protein
MPGREETPFDEAMELSSIRSPAIGLDADEVAFDPDVADLNDPDVENLHEPPIIGTRPRTSQIFGEDAENFGRATSPKLYAAASQFPTAAQFRVWRWENGVPVGLGAIDAEANEDEFVRKFFDAMPQPGEGRFQFRLRPIDVRGQELGKEFTINISEHHATLRTMRTAKKRREEDAMNPWAQGRGGYGPGGGDVIVQGGGEASATYAEEMGRMFEQAVEAAENRTALLQATLEEERSRLRDEEKQRVEERVSMAERSATVVQQMTERLMQSDRMRSEEAIKSQKEHSGFMMNTLTQVFTQQQEAARQQADRMREVDQGRMAQDREFFERQRQEMEIRRAAERDEHERRRRQEVEDWQRRRDEDRERMAAEQRRLETEAQRRESDAERRRQQDKDEMELRLQREKMELESRREQLRAEREAARAEMEDRRRREQQEFERKLALEREERERRERADRERWQQEQAAAERRREEERREWERRESMRREEMQREAERRREETQLQMKQMEMNAQRDREHSERMAEMARLEREAQRETQLAREKSEREARESAERERQRQYELQKFEMEQSKERDREHQERMMQLSSMNNQSSGGLSGLTEMLGMETPELLGKIFGKEDEKGWASAIPKVLGSIAEIGKVALTAPPGGGAPVEHGRRQIPGAEPQVAIQTPEGVKMVPASELQRLQASLPATSFIPGEPGMAEPVLAEGQEIPQELREAAARQAEAAAVHPVDEAREVNTLRRAKAAGMALADQRKARKAIRKLVEDLKKAPEDDWFGLVAAAITEEINVYHYINAVSVYAALAEVRADAGLADRIVKALKESGMIPEDLPYTEADYAARGIPVAEAATETPEPAAEQPKEEPKAELPPMADPEEDEGDA